MSAAARDGTFGQSAHPHGSPSCHRGPLNNVSRAHAPATRGLAGRRRWYAPRVRLASLVPFVLPLVLTACQGEEAGGVEASIARVTLGVDPAQADGLANLDLTVELETLGQPEEVTLASATLTQQPVSDSSPSIQLEAHMINTQGDDSVVRIAKRTMATVRILNDGTTNGELAAWCRLAVEVEVIVETADGEEATATADVQVGCP